MQIEIEFDDEKDAANIAKHGISLRAAGVLLSRPHLIDLDDRFAYGEERWKATGEIAGRLFVCIYAERGDVYRIISLRSATRREIDAYRENHSG